MKRGSLKRNEAGEARVPAPAQIMVPLFGYKNHVGIDRTFGFVRKWVVTHAARQRRARHRKHRPVGLGRPGLSLGEERGRDPPHAPQVEDSFSKTKGKPMARRYSRANAARMKVCSAVEHIFATQKSRIALFVRTIGIERARIARE